MSITRESNASVPTPALTTQSRGLAERSIKRRHVYTARVRATTQTHPTANCGPYPPVVRIPPESVITVWSAVCNLASNLSETDLNQAPACITKSRPFGEGRVSRVASLRGSRTPAGYQCRSARTPPRAESSSCPHPPRSLGSGSAALGEHHFQGKNHHFLGKNLHCSIVTKRTEQPFPQNRRVEVRVRSQRAARPRPHVWRLRNVSRSVGLFTEVYSRWFVAM